MSHTDQTYYKYQERGERRGVASDKRLPTRHTKRKLLSHDDMLQEEMVKLRQLLSKNASLSCEEVEKEHILQTEAMIGNNNNTEKYQGVMIDGHGYCKNLCPPIIIL